MIHAFSFSPEEGRRRLGKIISLLHEKSPLFYTLSRKIEAASKNPQCALHNVIGLDVYLLHDFLMHCQLFKVWRDNLVAWEELDLEDAGMYTSFVTARPHVGSRVELWFVKIGKDSPLVGTEMWQAMHYNVRMFGVAIDGPTSVMCDNQSAQKNIYIYISTSRLSKKNNEICYHKLCESVTAGWICVGWVKSEDNLADLFTKVLTLKTRILLFKEDDGSLVYTRILG